MKNIKIHKEGIRILFTVLLLLMVVNLVAIRQCCSPDNLLYILLATASSTFYAWLLYFFRDPVREVKTNDNHVLAPADGKVVIIKEVYEDEYFKDKRLQVSIFMSPFNVHVNRSPIAGVIKFFRYHAGRYWVAFNPKSSKQNERTTVVVEGKNGFDLMFRQVAGFVARRIKFYPVLGDPLNQGEKCGFIKFGSRMDVFLPPGTPINVALGDHVKGGLSVLADLEKLKHTAATPALKSD